MAVSPRSAKASYWQQLLDEHQRCGLSVKAFCDQKQIAPNSFYQWKRKLQSTADASTNAIIPVKLIDRPAASSSSNRFVQIWTPDGFSIRVDSATQVEELTTILRAVHQSAQRGEPC